MSADSIQRHLAEAHRARQEGLEDKAREHFEAVLAIDSEDPTALNFLGAEAMRRNDPRSAAAHFQIAANREPMQPAHWINLATAHRAFGDAEAERAALEKILEIDQRDLLASVRLAELHERQGEEALAEDRWKAVVALSRSVANPSPEFTQLVNHARTYVQGRRQKLGEAVEQTLASDLSDASVRDRRRMQVAADAWLGRREIFANHCEGLHYPFLPADEYFDRDHFPWLDQLEAATGSIAAELQAILAAPDPGLTPYISLPQGVPASKWSSLDKSLDWGAFHLWKEGERFDTACARAPRTAALVESLPICRIAGRAPNVFFSILKTGAHIPAHTGVTNVRSVVHLPLIVPEGCEFRVGGETRSWRVGEAFAFDDTIEHEAWNRSGEDRAVLIIDVWNPHLSEHERTMICRLYEAADRQRSPLG
jgi:aspartyl/asparaginyl beta-hydroxylase (cupin superfamily)/Tfp pilus assembly protein PilF